MTEQPPRQHRVGDPTLHPDEEDSVTARTLALDGAEYPDDKVFFTVTFYFNETPDR